MDSPIKSPTAATPNLTSYVKIWDARNKYKNVLLQVTLFVLIAGLFERLNYYGIHQGLMNFMTKHVGWSRVTASALKSAYSSIGFLSPLFGAYMADEHWGRFRVMMVFGLWYLIGELLVVISAHPNVEKHKSIMTPLFSIGLFVGIAFGAGASKSSYVTFGADQFNPEDDREARQKDSFFSYFYWSVNLGSIVSYGYLSTLCVEGAGFITPEYGYFGTFTLCVVVLGLSLCCLMLGKSRYVHQKPTKSAVSSFVRFAASAPAYHFKGYVLLYGSLIMLSSIFLNIGAAATSQNKRLSPFLAYLSAITVFVGIASWITVGFNPSFLDAAKKANGGEFEERQVEGYKALIRILPCLSFTIVWGCVYSQVDNNFQSMVQQCDLRWHPSDPESSQVPGAALGVFDPIVVVIAIPILDMCVYPLYTKLAGKRPSYYGRMAAGFALVVVCIVWAGCFEIIRRNSNPLMHNGKPILDDGGGQPMNHVYWVAAIPHYVLIGLVECFINVAVMDCCYSLVPSSLKSTAQALNTLMASMGSSLSSAVTLMFAKFTPSDDLNKGNLEVMFFALGVVAAINLAGFMVTMRKMNFGMHDSPKYVELDQEVC